MADAADGSCQYQEVLALHHFGGREESQQDTLGYSQKFIIARMIAHKGLLIFDRCLEVAQMLPRRDRVN